MPEPGVQASSIRAWIAALLYAGRVLRSSALTLDSPADVRALLPP